MKQGMILKIFFAVTTVAIILRAFVLDIVFISNNDLEPSFLAGDAILVSKLSSPRSEKWVLLKNHPSSGNYSVRRLIREVAPGKWAFSPSSQETSELPTIQAQKILGHAVMILWSRPCGAHPEGCGKRSSKFLSVIN